MLEVAKAHMPYNIYGDESQKQVMRFYMGKL